MAICISLLSLPVVKLVRIPPEWTSQPACLDAQRFQENPEDSHWYHGSHPNTCCPAITTRRPKDHMSCHQPSGRQASDHDWILAKNSFMSTPATSVSILFPNNERSTLTAQRSYPIYRAIKIPRSSFHSLPVASIFADAKYFQWCLSPNYPNGRCWSVDGGIGMKSPVHKRE